MVLLSHGKLAKSAVKTASVLALALAAGLAGGPAALIAALLLCALGDYLLSRPSEAQFMAGIGAFAAGHIAYVVLFLSHPLAQPETLLVMPQTVYLAVLAVFGVVMALLLWARAGAMRVPVLFYIPVILSMGAGGSGAACARPARPCAPRRVALHPVGFHPRDGAFRVAR